MTKAREIACRSDISAPELNTDGGEGAIHPPVVSRCDLVRGRTLGGPPSGGGCPAGNGCAECDHGEERGNEEVLFADGFHGLVLFTRCHLLGAVRIIGLLLAIGFTLVGAALMSTSCPINTWPHRQKMLIERAASDGIVFILRTPW